jgi:hypothetical protein
MRHLDFASGRAEYNMPLVWVRFEQTARAAYALKRRMSPNQRFWGGTAEEVQGCVHN